MGMGKELYHSYDEVKELFNKADEILKVYQQYMPGRP